MTVNCMPASSKPVEKIDDNFYIGKIHNKDLSLAIERITADNINDWLRYAKIQNWPRLIDYIENDENGKKTKGSLASGSGHFLEVLNTVPYNEHEVWVAYITKTKTPQKIPNMDSYKEQDVIEKTHDFAKNIEMFVSITTSLNALITSHMGIARSLESFKNGTRGISIDLHSFAAKVMIERNPNRKYLISAPVSIMEKIFAKALPNSFHSGTLEMQEKMKKRQLVTFEDFKNSIIPHRLKKAKEKAVSKPNCRYVQKQKFLKKLSEEEQFEFYKNPYHFESTETQKTASEEFLKFMEKHRPILSIKKKQMTIFNPKSHEPDVIVENDNKNYEWLEFPVHKPCGLTHYVVMDLQALASCKE